MGETFSVVERLRLRLGLSVYVGHRWRSGWRAPLPFYAFTCPRHGVVLSYPHGYGETLRCPRCLDEALKEAGE
jgi:hypothetical protein